MTRMWTSVWLLAAVLLLAACGDSRPAAPANHMAGVHKVAAVAREVTLLATTTPPEIANAYDELWEFAPDGILRWTEATGADAYEVWIFADDACTQLVEFSGTLTSRQYRFTRLTGNQEYWVRLYFRVDGAWGKRSDVHIKTVSPVVKPRLSNPQEELEAFASDGVLRWDAIEGADRYEVWIFRDRSLLAFAEFSGAIRETQYQVANLAPGATYYVEVYSQLAGEYHVGAAFPVQVTTGPEKARIINPQEELDEFATNGILRWTPVSGATAYEVWIYANPNSSVVQESSGRLAGRSYVTRTLQPGAAYYVQVYALVGGDWRVGEPIRITTTATTTIARLSNPQEELEALPVNGTLHWSAVPGADRYEVWIFGNAGLGFVAESGFTSVGSYQFSRLCGDATYYAQVYALVNGSWTVGWATRINVAAGESAVNCVPPAPVVSISANATEVLKGDYATLTWTSRFADACTASDAWSGLRPVSGSETVQLLKPRNLFTLVCQGTGGSTRAQFLVTASLRYRVIDLGTLGGDYSEGSAVNAAGQVTGWADTAELYCTVPPPHGSCTTYLPHAFLFADGVMIDIGLPGYPGRGVALNDDGEVVGWTVIPNGQLHAFLYSGGVLRDLGTLGGNKSMARAINRYGQVTGCAETSPGGATHAFLYSGGVMTDLGTLGGGDSCGLAINDAGQVTGYAGTGTGEVHAFLYSQGRMIDLGSLGGAASEGAAINAAGQVTGRAQTGVLGYQHAFLYRDGRMIDLGTLGGSNSSGTDINDAGQVAGSATDAADFRQHAFVFRGTSLAPIGLPRETESAGLAINERGEVLGCWAPVSWIGCPYLFLFSDGETWDLSPLFGDPASGSAINDAGQITGMTGRHAFLAVPESPPE